MPCFCIAITTNPIANYCCIPGLVMGPDSVFAVAWHALEAQQPENEGRPCVVALEKMQKRGAQESEGARLRSALWRKQLPASALRTSGASFEARQESQEHARAKGEYNHLKTDCAFSPWDHWSATKIGRVSARTATAGSLISHVQCFSSRSSCSRTCGSGGWKAPASSPRLDPSCMFQMKLFAIIFCLLRAL